jgi:uncharacterized protein
MRILKRRDYRVQPWKNGGGITTEIVADPDGADFCSFEWRISMAQVALPGPFSSLPGIDRSLGLLEGDGLGLQFADRGSITLRPGAHPVSFPGDIRVDATLENGAILDLNVMTRRGRWRHHLARVRVDGSCVLHRRGDVTVFLVRGPSAAVGDAALELGDALVLDHSSDASTEKPALQMQGWLWIADLWKM